MYDDGCHFGGSFGNCPKYLTLCDIVLVTYTSTKRLCTLCLSGADTPAATIPQSLELHCFESWVCCVSCVSFEFLEEKHIEGGALTFRGVDFFEVQCRTLQHRRTEVFQNITLQHVRSKIQNATLTRLPNADEFSHVVVLQVGILTMTKQCLVEKKWTLLLLADAKQ